MDKKLIERIKKMFALANCEGAAEGEAENAMRMANKLMEKYNLSSIDLHNSEDITIKFEDGTRWNWKRQIFNAIAELYSCECFREGSEQMLIVGTESDSVTASIVIHGLIDSIEKAGIGKGTAFRNGAALSIVAQCNDIIKERRQSTEKVAGTGLVLADVYDAKLDRARDFMYSNIKGLKSSSVRMNSSKEGVEFGRTLNPHARVSNKKALN